MTETGCMNFIYLIFWFGIPILFFILSCYLWYTWVKERKPGYVFFAVFSTLLLIAYVLIFFIYLGPPEERAPITSIGITTKPSDVIAFPSDLSKEAIRTGVSITIRVWDSNGEMMGGFTTILHGCGVNKAVTDGSIGDQSQPNKAFSPDGNVTINGITVSLPPQTLTSHITVSVTKSGYTNAVNPEPIIIVHR